MMNIVIPDADTLGKDLDLTIFNQYGKLSIYGYTDLEAAPDRFASADIIIGNKVKFNQFSLQNSKHLKLICLTATGTNNVDFNYVNRRQIKVCNVKDYSTNSVANHTFGLLFYLNQKLAYYDNYVKSGNYSNDKLFTHFDRTFHELSGKTWGIIGLGNIGRRVAELASGFGCPILHYSTSGRNPQTDYRQVDLGYLLANSDIISIHCPLNAHTDNLMDYSKLRQMKSNAILLNLGRGKIVNEADLAVALEQNIIACAGLDVLEHEPIQPDNPLLRITDSTRLIITPHIGWASIEARQTVLQEICRNIDAYLSGQERNIVTA